MTPILLVGLAALLIFLLGFLAGQGVETHTSMSRGKRQAARQREINVLCRALQGSDDELHLIAAVGPLSRYTHIACHEEAD